MDDYKTAPDDRLVALGRGGDPVAYGELVERHKDSLVNYLTSMTADRSKAEDLAQEAFLRFFQRAASYQPRGKLRAYLFRIASNLLRSQQRRQRRWQILSARFLPSGAGSQPAAAAERLLDRERDARVTAAVAGLPHRFRAPIVLFNVEGWSYREIAEALGCREGTVKSRIHRARRLLRRQLEPYIAGRSD